MSTDTEELVVEIAPDDLSLGHDGDGLPKTVPAQSGKTADATKTKSSPPKLSIDVDLLSEQLERQKKAAEDLRQARQRDQVDASAKLKAEQDRRIAKEEELETRTNQALNAHAYGLHREKDAIESAVREVQVSAASAERDYVAARESGDVAKEMAASRLIARAEVELLRLSEGKGGIERKIAEAQRFVEDASSRSRPAREDQQAADKTAKPEASKPQPTPDEWIDGVESHIGSKAANWLRENREYVTNPRLNHKLLKFAEAFEALEEKPLNSDDFIEALTEKFSPKPKREKEAQVAVDEETAVASDESEPAEKPVTRSAPSAPVSRGSSPGQSSTAKSITLSREAFAAAPEMYPAGDYDTFDDDIKRRFPRWSENAARAQYHAHEQRAKKDMKYKNF